MLHEIIPCSVCYYPYMYFLNLKLKTLMERFIMPNASASWSVKMDVEDCVDDIAIGVYYTKPKLQCTHFCVESPTSGLLDLCVQCAAQVKKVQDHISANCKFYLQIHVCKLCTLCVCFAVHHCGSIGQLLYMLNTKTEWPVKILLWNNPYSTLYNSYHTCTCMYITYNYSTCYKHLF